MKIFGITLGKQTGGGKQPQNAPQAQAGTGDVLAARRQRATVAIRKQPRREISWQIEDIKLALTMARNPDQPDRKRLLQIYDFILKDGHLESQVRTAKNDVLSEPWLLYRDKTPDETATALIQKRWFNNIIEYIIEAELWGYSVVEGDNISPEPGSKGGVILIDREYISIERQQVLLDGWINGSYIPYADYMMEMDLLQFGKHLDYGILLQCAYNVIWKFYSRSDWSRGSEKFGMPILSIIADTNNEKELNDIETKAANFGADGYIVSQKGDQVSILEAKNTRGHDIWLDNVNLCDAQISKIINGQTATSDQKSFTGAAQVQERTMQSFTQARLQNIVDEINENVLPYLIYKGFAFEGLTFNYPSLVRDREKRINGQPLQTDPEAAPDDNKDDGQPQPPKKGSKQTVKPIKPTK